MQRIYHRLLCFRSNGKDCRRFKGKVLQKLLLAHPVQQLTYDKADKDKA